MKKLNWLIGCFCLLIITPWSMAKEVKTSIISNEISKRVHMNDPRYAEKLKKYESKAFRLNKRRVQFIKKPVKKPADPRRLVIKRDVKPQRIVNKSRSFKFRSASQEKQHDAERYRDPASVPVQYQDQANTSWNKKPKLNKKPGLNKKQKNQNRTLKKEIK